MNGRLLKKGRWRKNWKVRHFVLEGSELIYCRVATDAEPMGRVSIEAVFELPERRGARPYRFDLLCTDARVLCLAATSALEQRAWVDALTASAPKGCLDISRHPRAAEFKRTVEQVAPTSACDPAVDCPRMDGSTSAMDAKQLFMSYPRGEQSSAFARWLKAQLQVEGYRVWMDEQGIRGGADFMQAIGDAIKRSHGIIAVIDAKFCSSKYCNNELAMAQGNNLQIFPILFRDLRFDQMPNGLQYMLATTNVIPFPDKATDGAVLAKMLAEMRSVLGGPGAGVSDVHCEGGGDDVQGRKGQVPFRSNVR